MQEKQKSPMRETSSSENKNKSDTNIYTKQFTAVEGNHRIEFYPNDGKDSNIGAKWVLYNKAARVDVRIEVGNKISSVVKTLGLKPLSIATKNIKTEEDKKKNRLYQSLVRRIKEYKIDNFLGYVTNCTTTKELHIMGWQNSSSINPVLFVIIDNELKIITGTHQTKGLTSRIEKSVEIVNQKEVTKASKIYMSNSRESFNFGKSSKTFEQSQHISRVEYVTVEAAQDKVNKVLDVARSLQAENEMLLKRIAELEEQLKVYQSV